MKVLLLHGFTSSKETVTGLIPHLEKEGMEVRVPWMRGHGTEPEDLIDVGWRDWLEDARRELLELSARGEKVAIMGLSMGALVGLCLAAEHRRRVSAVGTVAAALEFKSKHFLILPILKHLFTFWDTEPDYADPELAKIDNNYRRFPISAVESLYKFREVVKHLLPQVQAPLCLIESSADPVVAPAAADTIERLSSSEYCERHRLVQSRHEMLRDVERERVFELLRAFFVRVRDGELVGAV